MSTRSIFALHHFEVDKNKQYLKFGIVVREKPSHKNSRPSTQCIEERIISDWEQFVALLMYLLFIVLSSNTGILRGIQVNDFIEIVECRTVINYY